MSPLQEKRKSDLNNRFKLGFHFLWKLPSVFWWGIKVIELNENSCRIKIPYTWRTQNPFRSIYFAAQAGAAELSSGLIANIAVQGEEQISMLIVEFRMEYFKKANTAILFECTEGKKIFECVEEAKKTGEGQKTEVVSYGKNSEGEVVTKSTAVWSFKVKKV